MEINCYKTEMKNNRTHNLHTNFIIRTPLCPVQDNLLDLPSLFVFSQQENFKEGVYLESPLLHSKLIRWHKKELSDANEIKNLTIDLYKYYDRLQEPFNVYGLFAGHTIGTMKLAKDIQSKTSIKRNTSLDMNFMCALVQQLNRKEALLPYLRFHANKSIYVSGDNLRYVEYVYAKGSRVHQISVIVNSNYLQCLLKCAQNGAYLNELVACLTNDAITEKEALGFVKELIGSQVFVSELEPSITGDEFIYRVLTTLRRINNTDPEINAIVTLLENTQDEITSINLNGFRSVEN